VATAISPCQVDNPSNWMANTCKHSDCQPICHRMSSQGLLSLGPRQHSCCPHGVSVSVVSVSCHFQTGTSHRTVSPSSLVWYSRTDDGRAVDRTPRQAPVQWYSYCTADPGPPCSQSILAKAEWYVADCCDVGRISALSADDCGVVDHNGLYG